MRRLTGFWVRFVLLLAGGAALETSGAAGRFLHEPLTRILARLTVTLLAPFGPSGSLGLFVHFRGFYIEIADACDGVLPTYIFLAAVVAFPASWKEKGWAILCGVPAIFTMNLARLLSLLVLGAYWPGLFESVHIYVWQALVIAFSLALWVFWAERCARRPAAIRA